MPFLLLAALDAVPPDPPPEVWEEHPAEAAPPATPAARPTLAWPASMDPAARNRLVGTVLAAGAALATVVMCGINGPAVMSCVPYLGSALSIGVYLTSPLVAGPAAAVVAYLIGRKMADRRVALMPLILANTLPMVGLMALTWAVVPLLLGGYFGMVVLNTGVTVLGGDATTILLLNLGTLGFAAVFLVMVVVLTLAQAAAYAAVPLGTGALIWFSGRPLAQGEDPLALDLWRVPPPAPVPTAPPSDRVVEVPLEAPPEDDGWEEDPAQGP